MTLQWKQKWKLQTDRHTERQTDMQTDNQTDISEKHRLYVRPSKLFGCRNSAQI
jgi:hypothetical protein